MGADDREAFFPPKIGQVMPWLQHGSKVRAADFERAIIAAEARGFSRAVEALRDATLGRRRLADLFRARQGDVTARMCCEDLADYLESLSGAVDPSARGQGVTDENPERGYVAFRVEAWPHDLGANGHEYTAGTLPAADVARELRRLAVLVESFWADPECPFADHSEPRRG